MTSYMVSKKTMEINPKHSINLDEPTQFAGRIHRMIKLGLSIDDDDDLGGDDDLPPLEEVEGAADEASKMEEVD